MSSFVLGSSAPNNVVKSNTIIQQSDQSHDQIQHYPITNESTRFAQTRFPFLPFIIRFKTGNVTANQVKEEIIVHCKQMFHTEIQV